MRYALRLASVQLEGSNGQKTYHLRSGSVPQLSAETQDFGSGMQVRRRLAHPAHNQSVNSRVLSKYGCSSPPRRSYASEALVFGLHRIGQRAAILEA